MTAAAILAANAAAIILGENVDNESNTSVRRIELNDLVYIEGSKEDAQQKAKLEENKKSATSNENNKQIKCYCNDESVCPQQDIDMAVVKKASSSNLVQDKPFEIDNNFLLDMNSHQKDQYTKNEPMRFMNIQKLVNFTSGNIRHCLTTTMCLTKRVLRSNGDYWYKYSCDQAIANSIRGQVIEYRDCKINTPIEFDRNHVKETSSEFCCNEQDYCNVNLHPIKASRDLEDLPYINKNKKDKSKGDKTAPIKPSLNQDSFSSSFNNINFPNERNPIMINNKNNNNIGSIGSSGGAASLFLFNPVNISLSIVLFLFFFVILFLLACFLFKKSRKLKTKLKKSKNNKAIDILEKKKIIIEKDETEPKDDQNFSSSSSTKSSLSACSHLTGSTGQSQYSPSTTTTGGAVGDTSNTFQTTSSSDQFSHHNPHKNLLLTSHYSFMHTPLHEFENKIPLLTKLEQNNNEDNFDSGYESKLKNHKTPPPTKPTNFSSIIKSSESSNKISSENLLNFSSNTSSSGLNDKIIKTTNNNILLHSPLSSTSQSSGFGCGASSSIQTALTASPSDFEWSGSGSGAGFPQCVQRTIARQIKLFYPCIGKGRFGEVYKGEWRGEHVAVKTFNSADEKSWENECNIYNTNGFRHESILGFIAADNIDRGTYTELWLITEFHENGSLFDYLTANTITPMQALNMGLSIVNGLVHLHMPIESCKGKPALAHCDLKSKNILVKTNLTCCIGDLGLALSGDKDGKISSSNVRTGTKRYMAPEILSKRIEIKYLDAFQKAEMYSLALIFWELLRRCKFEDESTKTLYTFEYKPPYYEFITGDPDENLMRQIVCEQNHRPVLNPLWRQNVIMNEFVRLTEELWVEMPNERLNALRLKKSITKIKTNFLENQKSNNL